MIPEVEDSQSEEIEYVPQEMTADVAPAVVPELAGASVCVEDPENPKVLEARRLQKEACAKRKAEGDEPAPSKRPQLDLFAQWQENRRRS